VRDGVWAANRLPVLLASWFICGLYYWFLGLACRSSEFTIVYPVARALPVLIVAARAA
jgi:hypothetical protein